mmetsp:Transcript_27198/g.30917  ORF Transcript_27198/g.30917 Transcript_27198/m.30917 type:complete len:112 (+) Transcript_27198:20-355(+)
MMMMTTSWIDGGMAWHSGYRTGMDDDVRKHWLWQRRNRVRISHVDRGTYQQQNHSTSTYQLLERTKKVNTNIMTIMTLVEKLVQKLVLVEHVEKNRTRNNDTSTTRINGRQ